KEAGFNMLRKHVKVESRRFYYLCDKLGLMIWQDMPNANNGRRKEDENLIREARTQFEHELENMIETHINHPCIIVWVPFNEGWGQYDSGRITDLIKEWDSSRLVNHASGWTDRGFSDIKDFHAYPGPRAPEPEEERASVLGEFGGLGLNVQGHSWQEEGWGYALMSTQDDLLARYERLYMDLLPMIDRDGLSAAVYTQTSDIETENNGLLTYDREMMKIDPERLSLVHRGYLPPKQLNKANIFIDEADVELECVKEGYTIHYTLDGSVPSLNSSSYDSLVRLTNSTEIKARAFWEDGESSRVVSFDFEKVTPLRSVKVADRNADLTVKCYEGSWNELPDFSTLEPFEEKTTSKIDLSVTDREQNIGLIFEGYVDIPETGVYIFYTATDDGSRLYIGDEMLVDNDGIHGTREKSGAIALEKGLHPIKVEYFQRRGGISLKVFYEGPGIDKAEIPGNVLFRSGR
ncbi:MAG: hypothetical protein GY863_12650, partial [bacterium]|nr:hypothetical protein [bacterium]